MQNSHRFIQLAIKEALAPQEVWLEKSFPEIGRVADVVWPCRKIIFEIQYSPISAREVKERNRDYGRLGYTVIWILHERRYNRTYLTPAERFLRLQTHYFTNINSLGQGEIYDQYARVRRGRRVERTPCYPITLSHPSYLKQIPRHFPKERRKWKYSFEGDLFHQAFKPVKFSLLRLYRLLFQLLLEKVNR
ncbi:MAG: hypothetical protein JJU12_01090 [Chlamydiales bacterium]|nr:hypothetical protein [Chlamydiales bacterium]